MYFLNLSFRAGVTKISLHPETRQPQNTARKQKLSHIFWDGRPVIGSFEAPALWNRDLRHSLLYWHPVLECWFKSQLLCFWTKFLLMHLGKHYILDQITGPSHLCGKPPWNPGFWLSYQRLLAFWYGHLKSEPIDERSLPLCVCSQSFITLPFK